MVITTKKHCLSEAREEMMLIKMLQELKMLNVLRLKPTSFLVSSVAWQKKPSCVKISRLPMFFCKP